MPKKVLIPVVFSICFLVACSPYAVPPKESFKTPTVNLVAVHQKSATYSRLYEDCSQQIDPQLREPDSFPGQREAAILPENDKDGAKDVILKQLQGHKGFTPDHLKDLLESAQKSFVRIELDTQHPFVLMDAVSLAIQFNRDIQKSHMQYQQSLGNLEVTSGAFDPSITADYSFTPSYSSADGESVIETETSFYSVGVQKMSRFGLETNAIFALNGDQRTLNSRDTEVGQGQLGLTFTMPVLKQSGIVSVDAEERANMLVVESSLASVVHQINSTLNDIAGYYWDYVAALHQLLLGIDAELRSRVILNDTKVLVANSIQATSTLIPLRADLATKVSARRVYEQNIFEARNQLAVSLGFPAKLAKTLPAPTSNFAKIDIATACSIRENEKSILNIALGNRQDMRAADFTVQQSKILEKKYKNDLLPSLSLIAGMTQTGFTPSDTLEDMFDSPHDGEFAVNAGIQMAFPVYNQTAQGQLRNQMGQTREQQLEYITVKETITSDIYNAVTGLFNAVEVVQLSEYAEEQYLQSTNDEFQKFKLGLNSILDVLNTTDNLNASRQNTVTARLNLATAIAGLRYGSATFFDGTADVTTVSETELVTPFPAAYMDTFIQPKKCEEVTFD